MKLSQDFELKEFTTSRTALKNGIDNTPPDKLVENIKRLVNWILQPARGYLGMVITVVSGYRCKELNAKVGGANGSQHTKGEAADLTCNDNARLFNYIASYCEFDQLIWEFGDDEQPEWVHVSVKEKGNRRQKLRAVNVNGKVEYINV